eukprot:scaffold13134_cov108-Cylindrotheca_fusiformis.AAC.1
MKFSGILVALLLHHFAHAAEGENFAKETGEKHLRKHHKRERKGAPGTVRYFTLEGHQANVTKSRTHQHHHQHERNMRTRIVG